MQSKSSHICGINELQSSIFLLFFLGFTFRSMDHFELIFVNCARHGQLFLCFLYRDSQVFQHHVLFCTTQIVRSQFSSPEWNQQVLHWKVESSPLDHMDVPVIIYGVIPPVSLSLHPSTLLLLIRFYSLEGLTLKLKLPYFEHLMQRTDSLEKTLILGKIEGRRKE